MILGILHHYKLTVIQIRQILGQYGRQNPRRDKKHDLLQRLVWLENELGQAHSSAIGSWVLDHGSLEGLGAIAGRFLVRAECSVCMEMFAVADSPDKITSSCQHAAVVCLGCTTESINTQIMDKAWNEISCPECLELLSFQEVKRFAGPEDFER